MSNYDDTTLAVLGVLALGPATTTQLSERVDCDADSLLNAIARLLRDKRIVHDPDDADLADPEDPEHSVTDYRYILVVP